MSTTGRSRADEMLDLLAEAVAARLEARAAAKAPAPVAPAAPLTAAETAPDLDAAEDMEPEVAPAPHADASRLIRRLALGLLVILVLINIPINRHGTSLARSLPGSAALVIHNGLVVKEADNDAIYVFRDDQFHWISSLKAFEHHGYRWSQVHIVEPGFMQAFELGAPIHVLLKCPDSPHIYRLENDHKRWIVDIPTFEAEGHVWEDVEFVTCDALRAIPDGETIPPGRGPAPQP